VKSKFPTREAVLALLKKHTWYHDMELVSGIKTPGRNFVNLIPVAALMRFVEFEGLKCLDLGAQDGKMAFMMEKKHARVVAADVFEKPSLTDLIELFGYEMACEFGVTDSAIVTLRDKHGMFDFVLCTARFGHSYSPLKLILDVRKLVRNGGYAVFEGACMPEPCALTMTFNRRDIYHDLTTLWVPSLACLRYMLRYACFRVVAEATLDEGVVNERHATAIPRHAVLVQADKPSRLVSEAGEDPLLRAVYAGQPASRLWPDFDWTMFEEAEESRVVLKPDLKPQRAMHLLDPLSFVDETRYLRHATPAHLP